MILVQDINAGDLRDIPGGDDLGALGADGQAPRPLHLHADGNALEVQDDVGHVLAHPGHGGKLVKDVVDLNAGDGGALKRGHKDAAKRVSQRQAEAALQRLRDHGRLPKGVVARLHVQLRRLDKFLPVLVDHVNLLNPCARPMSETARSRGTASRNAARG